MSRRHRCPTFVSLHTATLEVVEFVDARGAVTTTTLDTIVPVHLTVVARPTCAQE